jgi:cell division protein FtsL
MSRAICLSSMETLIEIGKLGLFLYFGTVLIALGVFVWFVNKLFK